MPPLRRLLLYASLAIAAGCGHGSKPEPLPTPTEHSLAGLAAQHVVMLPTYAVRVVPPLLWNSAIGRPTDVQRTLDADILAAFEDRGIRKNWIFPDDLAQSYKRNSMYATDPYALAEEPLRSPGLFLDARLPDPLATQLRTLIALHEETWLVLASMELRFEQAGSGGRGVLRLVLVDPRFSAVRWIGEIASDTASTFGPVISASIAAKLAGIVSIQ